MHAKAQGKDISMAKTKAQQIMDHEHVHTEQEVTQAIRDIAAEFEPAATSISIRRRACTRCAPPRTSAGNLTP